MRRGILEAVMAKLNRNELNPYPMGTWCWEHFEVGFAAAISDRCPYTDGTMDAQAWRRGHAEKTAQIKKTVGAQLSGMFAGLVQKEAVNV